MFYYPPAARRVSRSRLFGCLACACLWIAPAVQSQTTPPQPNILVIILDDWGQGDSGAEGAASGFLSTPAMDRIASEGLRFTNAVCAAPSCAPSRAALLTGRNPWQLEEAANLTGLFPAKYTTYPDVLEEAGYKVGYTGKGWGPGALDSASGRSRNPAGPVWNTRTTNNRWTTGCSTINYWKNFEDFLAARSPGQKFCFWVGINEPHRSYQAGTGTAALPPPVGDPLYNSSAIANPAQPAKTLADAQVPPWLPQHDTVRADVMDYAREVEYANWQIGKILDLLDAQNLANDTLVILCTDNGRPFARAKQNIYQAGIRTPLFIRWPSGIANPGRVLTDHVSLIDLAPTFYELADVSAPIPVTGKSLKPLLDSTSAGRIDAARDSAMAGMERHGYARPDDVGYPMRALRTDTHLYIRNFKPDRYPAGNPTNDYFTDIDNGPAKTFLIENQSTYPVEAAICLGLRPGEELYDLAADPTCLTNLAANPAHAATLESLREDLAQRLRDQGDPRILGYGDLFDGYARHANPNWNQGGTFKPDGSGTPNATYINAGNAILNSDSDGDGLRDIEEHYFGTRHDLPNASPVSVENFGADSLTLTFPHRRAGMDFTATAEGCGDLASWSSNGTTTAFSGTGITETGTATLPSSTGATRWFGRLRITKP